MSAVGDSPVVEMGKIDDRKGWGVIMGGTTTYIMVR